MNSQSPLNLSTAEIKGSGLSILQRNSDPLGRAGEVFTACWIRWLVGGKIENRHTAPDRRKPRCSTDEKSRFRSPLTHLPTQPVSHAPTFCSYLDARTKVFLLGAR